jgi:carboxypeptidase Q
MRSAVLICVTLLLLVPVFVAAQSSNTTTPFRVAPETRDTVQRLIGDSILNGRAYEFDDDLADRIGPRLTGSANYIRAAEGMSREFQSLGLSNVRLENWTIPATWEPDGPAVGYLMSPVEHRLHIYSLGWSPSTPQQGVTGNVFYISSLAIEALDAQKSQIAGRIALIDPASFGPKRPLDFILGGLDHLRSLGPLAIVNTGGPRGTESQSSLEFAGTITSVPQAQIGLEDSLLIKRLLKTDSVLMHFQFTNTIRTSVSIPNVIAEIPGRELSGEVVIVGAHLDSWEPGTGAQDNGTGAASVVEAARAIKALGRPPRRTIRFILFGGEEEGLLGSTAYVRAHLADLPKIDAVLITDSGAAPAKGWYVMGREDERPSLAALKPLLEGLGADGITSETGPLYSTDHAAFNVLGVPTLVLWNDQGVYDMLHHKASDTFDSVVEKDLTQGATVFSVTAYAIADSDQPFAPHLSPDDVKSMIQKTGTIDSYNYLKSIGALP